MTTLTADTDPAEAGRVQFDRQALTLRTFTPGVVVAVAPDGTTVDVQPAISLVQRLEGAAVEIRLPVLRGVPVHVSGSQTLGLFACPPIAPGDEGMIIVSDRALDAWQHGEGVAPPPDMATPRHHDLSDAAFVPGLQRVSGAIPAYPTDAFEIRTRDGTVKASVSAAAATLTAPGGSVTVDATGVHAVTPGASAHVLAASATLTVGAASVGVSGGGVAIVAPGGLSINGSQYLDHTHVKGGGASTEGVTP